MLIWNLIQTQQYSKGLQVIEYASEQARAISPKICATFWYLRGLLYEHCGNVAKILRGTSESLDSLPTLVERKKALLSVQKKQKSRSKIHKARKATSKETIPNQ